MEEMVVMIILEIVAVTTVMEAWRLLVFVVGMENQEYKPR
jgi:hypothetical protein